MRTEPAPQSAASLLESGSRFMRMMLLPWTPLITMTIAVVAFWIFEAALHVVHFDNHSFLRDLLRPDAHELWMRLVVTMMLMLVGVAWRVANMERHARIASLERYQRRLQELTLELASADNEERRALARRLHDDVGQQLAAARMFLAAVDDEKSEDAAALRSARRIIERATSEVRDVAEELTPRALDEFGLNEALSSLARRMMRRSGVSIDVEADASCAVEPDSGRVAFQVAAEVLEYAVRQEAAGTVIVRCSNCADLVELSVCWQGEAAHDFFSQAQRMSGVGGALAVTPMGDRICVSMTLPQVAA